MNYNLRADDDQALLALVLPNSPVTLAYERGYADGLSSVVAEVARLRTEMAVLLQRSRELVD